MRKAIPLGVVRDHLERAIAAYGPPDAVVDVRRAHLEWLARKDLTRAEGAGVGAILASDLDFALEQLALLGEQLHAQGRTGAVPRSLTERAVAPYWSGATALSADPGGQRGEQLPP